MSAGKDRHEVLDLTKRLVQDFFAKNDTSLFLRLAADDILWLGGGSTMLADGRDAVQEFYRQGLVGMRRAACSGKITAPARRGPIRGSARPSPAWKRIRSI